MLQTDTQNTVLGRQKPKFNLGDLVAFPDSSGVEHGIVIGIAFFHPFGPVDDEDEWFYELHVYESDKPRYWELRRRLEANGTWMNTWAPESGLMHDSNRNLEWVS